MVQWLAHWTLNPIIRVQISVGPFLINSSQNIFRFYFRQIFQVIRFLHNWDQAKSKENKLMIPIEEQISPLPKSHMQHKTDINEIPKLPTDQSLNNLHQVKSCLDQIPHKYIQFPLFQKYSIQQGNSSLLGIKKNRQKLVSTNQKHQLISCMCTDNYGDLLSISTQNGHIYTYRLRQSNEPFSLTEQNFINHRNASSPTFKPWALKQLSRSFNMNNVSSIGGGSAPLIHIKQNFKGFSLQDWRLQSNIELQKHRFATKIQYIKVPDKKYLAYLTSQLSKDSKKMLKNSKLHIQQYLFKQNKIESTLKPLALYPQNLQNQINIQDFQFCITNHPYFVAYVSLQGLLEIKQLRATDLVKQRTRKYYLYFIGSYDFLGKLCPSCLSWSKDQTKKYYIIAVGCKSNNQSVTINQQILLTTYKQSKFKIGSQNTLYLQQERQQAALNTIAFVYFYQRQNRKQWKLQKIRCEIFEKQTVNDIQWAYCNGRSYNLLAIATKVGLKIYEIKFFNEVKNSQKRIQNQNGQQINHKISVNSKKLQVLKQIILIEGQQCLKVHWNLFGNSICVEQESKSLIFSSIKRGLWVLHKKID